MSTSLLAPSPAGGTAASVGATGRGLCRFCGERLHRTFVDLGMSPLCESYVPADALDEMEAFYPLHVYVCERCWLVQLQEYVSRENIFSEYAYFSSYSDSWLSHARRYTEQACERFALTKESRVVEVASNDGYLLQYFVERGIPVLGIEPAANVARAAVAKGVPTLVEFFGRALATRLVAEGRPADLLIGNNVLAQVHDLNDFVAGLEILLAPEGVITIEFPHLMRLVEENQFDTIYHEHFSYFSFLSAETIFAAHGLRLFDVEELRSHGGSLRIYACRADDGSHPRSERADELAEREAAAGLLDARYYTSFAHRVEETKRKLLQFLIEAKGAGKTVVGYGAPGKGNTLLNYCGVRTDFLDYTVDRSPYKQGKFLPGTHIPILSPERIAETRPDFVLILPWNLKEEIMTQLSFIRDWGGRFVVPIPETNGLRVIFTETQLPGAYLIEPEPRRDERGFFARVWCEHEAEAHGLEGRMVQCSLSHNRRRGTLRGMHFQAPPHAESKLIRCTRGEIHDVVIDLRPQSPTFLQHLVVRLSAENRRALYVPPGFAHGFQTMCHDTEVLYQMSEFFAPDHARGVRWNDPAFGIDWPVSDPIILERDARYPDFMIEVLA